MKRSAEPSGTTPGNRLRKQAEAEAYVTEVMSNLGKICSILTKKKLRSFDFYEYNMLIFRI